MSEALPPLADRPQLRRWLRLLTLLQLAGLAVAAGLLQQRGMPAGAALGWVIAAWALLLWLCAAGGFALKALHGDWPARVRGGIGRASATLMVESGWMLRLFLYDMPWRAAPMHLVRDGRRPAVLLVHGFLCNGAVWRPLEGELRAAGLAYAAVSLQPSYRSFERQLADDSAIILKFWLHISKKEQARRFRKLAQWVNGFIVWFKEFGDPRKLNYETGEWDEKTPREKLAEQAASSPEVGLLVEFIDRSERSILR